MNQMKFKALSPTGILGYGFPEESFRRGVEKKPDLIAVDAGSTDPGPYYLGAGKSFTDEEMVKRDLRIMLKAAIDASIPCVIGSAGGCGAQPHLTWTEQIIKEIALEEDLSFKMAVISADMDKLYVKDALQNGHIQPLGPIDQLTGDDIDASVRIVAQMGEEPVLKALDLGCHVILCGRCYDPVVFAAPAIYNGFPRGLAYHMGKILECAAIAATPGSGADCVLATLSHNDFILESLNPQRRFSRSSTAAHTLYEKSDPYLLPGPGGAIYLKETVFEDIGDGRVKVSGTKYIPAEKNTVKLEGVKHAGMRTICIAGVRDPILIGQLDEVIEKMEELAGKKFYKTIPEYKLMFHVYGKDAIMGKHEPKRNTDIHEVGIVIEVIAPTQEQAGTVCSFVRSTLLHYGYDGRISTAGNLALLYSPSDVGCGDVYQFNVHHLMEINRSINVTQSLFPLKIMEVC